MLFDNGGRYYVYSTLSNALLEVEYNDYASLKSLMKDNKGFDALIFDTGLRTALIDKHIITEDNRDDFLLYQSHIQRIREQRDSMHLTIAPTMDCNFRCFYCFEKNKSRKYMSDITMDSIVSYVQNIPDLKHIKLTWFGGEPLMAKEQMALFHKKLAAAFMGKIDSTIITAGYYIDHNTPALFRTLGITSVQITLDGNKASHNRIKFTAECGDVFTKVIDNALFLSSEIPDITISFRINMTRKNSKEYTEVYKYLSNRFKGRRVSISPAIVKNKNSRSSTGDCIYFDRYSFAGYILDLFHTHGIHTPFIRYPVNQICECAIRDKMSISFDPEGFAYKCWEKIGDHNYSIGRISPDGKLEDINLKELNRELYGADPINNQPCRDCQYLPICNGGCPIERIQNEFEGYSNDTCTFYKDMMEEFLKAHIIMKEINIDNK